MNVINLPARDWTATNLDDGNQGRLASVTLLAGHVRRNNHRPRLDVNDDAAFDGLVDKIRSMTDAELANTFHAGPELILSLRELAS